MYTASRRGSRSRLLRGLLFVLVGSNDVLLRKLALFSRSEYSKPAMRVH